MPRHEPPNETDDHKYRLETSGGEVIAGGDTRHEVARTAEELRGSYLVFGPDGGYSGAFDSLEAAREWILQRSYDMRPREFWGVVHDGEVVYGDPSPAFKGSGLGDFAEGDG